MISTSLYLRKKRSVLFDLTLHVLYAERQFCFWSSYSWRDTKLAAVCIVLQFSFTMHRHAPYDRSIMFRPSWTVSSLSIVTDDATRFIHINVSPTWRKATRTFKITNSNLTTFEVWMSLLRLCWIYCVITIGFCFKNHLIILRNWCHKAKTKQNGNVVFPNVRIWLVCKDRSASRHHKPLKTVAHKNTTFSYSDPRHTNSQYFTWVIPNGVKLQYNQVALRTAILETFGTILLYLVSPITMCQSAPSKRHRTTG